MNKIELKRDQVYKMKKHKQKIKSAKSTIGALRLKSSKAKAKKKRANGIATSQTRKPATQSEILRASRAGQDTEESVKKLSSLLFTYLTNNSRMFKKKNVPDRESKRRIEEAGTADTLKNDRYDGLDQRSPVPQEAILEEHIRRAPEPKKMLRSRRRGRTRKPCEDKTISEFTLEEKNDVEQIPLYNFLKKYNLQQYAKQLVTEGFGYDLSILVRLNAEQRGELLGRVKFIPGHRFRFEDALQDLELSFPGIKKNRDKKLKPRKKKKVLGARKNSQFKGPKGRRIRSNFRPKKEKKKMTLTQQHWYTQKPQKRGNKTAKPTRDEKKNEQSTKTVDYKHDAQYLVTGFDSSFESQLSEELFSDEYKLTSEEEGGDSELDLGTEILNNVFFNKKIEQVQGELAEDPKKHGGARDSGKISVVMGRVFSELKPSTAGEYLDTLDSFDFDSLKSTLVNIISLHLKNQLIRELSRGLKDSPSGGGRDSHRLFPSELFPSQSPETVRNLSRIVDALYSDESWTGGESKAFFNRLRSEGEFGPNTHPNFSVLNQLFLLHKQMMDHKEKDHSQSETVDLEHLESEFFLPNSTVSLSKTDEAQSERDDSLDSNVDDSLSKSESSDMVNQQTFKSFEDVMGNTSVLSENVKEEDISRNFVRSLKQNNSIFKVKTIQLNTQVVEKKTDTFDKNEAEKDPYPEKGDLIVEFDQREIEKILFLISPKQIFSLLVEDFELTDASHLFSALHLFYLFLDLFPSLSVSVCRSILVLPFVFQEYLHREQNHLFKTPFDSQWVHTKSQSFKRVRELLSFQFGGFDDDWKCLDYCLRKTSPRLWRIDDHKFRVLKQIFESFYFDKKVKREIQIKATHNCKI